MRSDHDIFRGVAVRLSAFCLSDGGRLGRFSLWDDAIRAALLVDLALADRLWHTADSIVLDGTPTGFGPADRLLAAVTAEAEHSLDWWMAHGGVDLADVAAANVASGRWVVRRRLFGRRYEDLEEHASSLDYRLDPRTPPPIDEPTAAVLTLAMASGAVEAPPEPPGEDLLVQTGRVRWICDAAVEHLRTAHRRNRDLALVLRVG